MCSFPTHWTYIFFLIDSPYLFLFLFKHPRILSQFPSIQQKSYFDKWNVFQKSQLLWIWDRKAAHIAHFLKWQNGSGKLSQNSFSKSEPRRIFKGYLRRDGIIDTSRIIVYPFCISHMINEYNIWRISAASPYLLPVKLAAFGLKILGKLSGFYLSRQILYWLSIIPFYYSSSRTT